jgi:hypothetical protein
MPQSASTIECNSSSSDSSYDYSSPLQLVMLANNSTSYSGIRNILVIVSAKQIFASVKLLDKSY